MRIWVFCLGLTMFDGVVLAVFSAFHSGGTVVLRDGQYVLLHGNEVEHIDQRIAAFVRIASLLFAATGVVAVILTAAMKIVTGTMNPFVLLRRF